MTDHACDLPPPPGLGRHSPAWSAFSLNRTLVSCAKIQARCHMEVDTGPIAATIAWRGGPLPVGAFRLIALGERLDPRAAPANPGLLS